MTKIQINKFIGFSILLFIFFNLPAFAQKTRKINQEDLGMKYQLPQDWEVDGFGGSNWEEPGSSVCECSGTINIGNRFAEDEIYMVVYPAMSKDSLNTHKREKIWDLEFEPNGEKTEIKTEKLVFEKIISKFKPGAEKEYANKEVWQLKTQSNNQFYVFYFWANPGVLKSYESTITGILKSFVAVKVK